MQLLLILTSASNLMLTIGIPHTPAIWALPIEDRRVIRIGNHSIPRTPRADVVLLVASFALVVLELRVNGTAHGNARAVPAVQIDQRRSGILTGVESTHQQASIIEYPILGWTRRRGFYD